MKRGDVILTPFPFTDLTAAKVRPALIISSDKRKGEDILICFISSVFNSDLILETDIPIEANNSEFICSGLKTQSIIKCDKIATISKNIILGELGYFTDDLMQKVNNKLKIIFALT